IARSGRAHLSACAHTATGSKRRGSCGGHPGPVPWTTAPKDGTGYSAAPPVSQRISDAGVRPRTGFYVRSVRLGGARRGRRIARQRLAREAVLAHGRVIDERSHHHRGLHQVLALRAVVDVEIRVVRARGVVRLVLDELEP